MDAKFLTSQLSLMSNLAEKYLRLIPPADWCHLINLANEKDDYITNIIELDTRPRGQIKAREAHSRFIETVINHTEPLARAA
jgi:hypothetical protein